MNPSKGAFFFLPSPNSEHDHLGIFTHQWKLNPRDIYQIGDINLERKNQSNQNNQKQEATQDPGKQAKPHQSGRPNPDAHGAQLRSISNPAHRSDEMIGWARELTSFVGSKGHSRRAAPRDRRVSSSVAHTCCRGSSWWERRREKGHLSFPFLFPFLLVFKLGEEIVTKPLKKMPFCCFSMTYFRGSTTKLMNIFKKIQKYHCLLGVELSSGRHRIFLPSAYLTHRTSTITFFSLFF